MYRLLYCPPPQGALGNPLIPTPEALASLKPEVLHSFVASHYTGPRWVMSAGGWLVCFLTMVGYVGGWGWLGFRGFAWEGSGTYPDYRTYTARLNSKDC